MQYYASDQLFLHYDFFVNYFNKGIIYEKICLTKKREFWFSQQFLSEFIKIRPVAAEQLYVKTWQN
jgi:hypothetical protein